LERIDAGYRDLPIFLRQDLDELIASEAQPAVSLYLPTHVAGPEIRQNALRLKNIRAQTAERPYAEWRRSEIDSFLAPADSIVENDEFWRHQENGLAVFWRRTSAAFINCRSPSPRRRWSAPIFHIKPLLPVLEDAGPFRVLTISSRHTRLYQGSRWTFAEVERIGLPQGVGEIADLTQYENTHDAAPSGRHRGGLAKAQTLGEAPEEVRKPN
jgi:hypothetical protein